MFMVILAASQETKDEDEVVGEVVKVDCNPACPFIYRPVCGGVSGEIEETFTNECMLKLRNCVKRSSTFDCLSQANRRSWKSNSSDRLYAWLNKLIFFFRY